MISAVHSDEDVSGDDEEKNTQPLTICEGLQHVWKLAFI